MKNKFIKIILALFLLIPLNVRAEGFSVGVSCPSTASAGSKITCNVSATPSGINLRGISGAWSFTSGITFNSFSVGSGIVDYYNGSSSGIALNISNGISSSTSIGTLTVTLPSNAQSNSSYIVKLTGVNGTDSSYNDYNANDASSTIRIISNENRLSDLSIGGASINFNPDVNNYNVTINNTSTTINATKMDSGSVLSGNVGNVTLNYGPNKFYINVKSESGQVRTYTINITRPDSRSSNNYLSSLIVTNTDINFNKTIQEYNLTTTASEVTISGAKEDSKSTVSGNGKQTLKIGLNTFYITVLSESGSKRIYTINITRNDTRNSNNYLKSLSLDKGKINFNKTTIKYNVDVEKDVNSVVISASVEDDKASFVSNYGPRTVSLNPGNNTVLIKVQNEKGEQRTYTLYINRDDGRDSDSSLKSINISSGKIDFKPDVLNYELNVEYDVETFKIEAVPTSEKSKVNIEGNEELVVGENKFKITVEAENGKITTYNIVVERKEEGYKLSNNNYIKSMTIKNHEIDFDSDVFNYNIKTKDNKLNINVILKDKKAKYSITGNNKLKNNSKVIIKVTAEDGSIRKYTLNIEKKSYLGIIILIILVILMLGVGGYIIYLKIKEKNNNKNINNDLNNNDVNVNENDQEQEEVLDFDFSAYE